MALDNALSACTDPFTDAPHKHAFMYEVLINETVAVLIHAVAYLDDWLWEGSVGVR